MIKISRIVICVSAMSGVVLAQFDQSQLAMSQSGVGVRALSMANSVVSVVSDASALYWNPGALAFCPVRELSASLSGTVNSSVASGAEVKDGDEGRIQRIALGNVSWLNALPTSQGGMSIAVGLQNPYSLDYLVGFSGKDSSRHFKADGRMYMLSGGFGFQIAPGIGLGIAPSLLFGNRNISINDSITTYGDIYNYDIKQHYVGFDLRGGAVAEIASWLRMGLMIDAPQAIHFSEENDLRWQTGGMLYSNTDPGSGSIRGTVNGSIGAAVKAPWFLVSTQFDARAPRASAQKELAVAYWKIGGGASLELPVAKSGMILRGGYSRHEFDPAPYQLRYSTGDNVGYISDAANVKANHGDNLVSGGLAYEGSTLSVEGGGSYRFWSITNSQDITYKMSTIKIDASLSYRF